MKKKEIKETEKVKSRKLDYVSPSIKVYELKIEGMIMTSPKTEASEMKNDAFGHGADLSW